MFSNLQLLIKKFNQINTIQLLLLLTVLVAALAMPSAQAFDYDLEDNPQSAGATGDQYHDNLTTNTWLDYNQLPARGQKISNTATNFKTGNQSVGNRSGGPDLYGTPYRDRGNLYTRLVRAATRGAGSGAATSAPARSTYFAPGNLALKQQNKTNLPPTVLDSFVLESGLDEDIYGNEGDKGPPEEKGFKWRNRIAAGIAKSGSNMGLTTGHASQLPSAWGRTQDEEYISGPVHPVSKIYYESGIHENDSTVLTPVPEERPTVEQYNGWIDRN